MHHSFADDNGPFLGLGVSYFTALWRCKHDRPRLEKDLAFLAKQGFNYYRMLSMVGSESGVSRVTRISFRRSLSWTSAARWMRLRRARTRPS